MVPVGVRFGCVFLHPLIFIFICCHKDTSWSTQKVEEFIRVTDSMLHGLLFVLLGQLGRQRIFSGRKWPWKFSLLFTMCPSPSPNLSRAARIHFIIVSVTKRTRMSFVALRVEQFSDPWCSQLPWSLYSTPAAWLSCDVVFLESLGFCQSQWISVQPGKPTGNLLAVHVIISSQLLGQHL
jgi:hypothetical protein